MSYSSYRNIISMIAGILSIIVYIVYTFSATPPQGDIQAWAIHLLIFIGISVGVQIVIQILFHIGFAIKVSAKEGTDKNVERIMSSEAVEDERDKLISLKSSHIAYIVTGAGFMISLIALALGMSVIIALHITVGIYAVSSIIEGFINVYLHERGVRNG